jgi:hypothetical protein
MRTSYGESGVQQTSKFAPASLALDRRARKTFGLPPEP